MITMQQAMQAYLTQLNGQISEYQANVNNTLQILNDLQSSQQAVATWLAQNPAA